MKKLLNTLYVTSENSYLSLDGENIVIYDADTECGRLPLHNLEGIVSFGYRGTSPALMGACVDRNISLSYLTPQGKFLARISGKVRGNVILREQQYESSKTICRINEVLNTSPVSVSATATTAYLSLPVLLLYAGNWLLAGRVYLCQNHLIG